MTINHVFERLHAIDLAAAALLRDTGFHPDDGLGKAVLPLQDACEDAFLRDMAQGLLEPFELLHEELCYLETPAHGEHTLSRFPNGLYGYRDGDGKEHIFPSGKTLEAKIHDRSGRLRWVRTRIEHDGLGYFLWGYGHVPLPGLTVRERW